MDIFQKIKELREGKKITQSEMAERLGISQAAYAKIERPTNPEAKKISIEYGKVIAKTLEISFNELFEIAAPITTNNEGCEEEWIYDKKKIIRFLSDNDFTFDIASRIYHRELDQAGLLGKSMEYTRMQFGLSSETDIKFTEKEKELFKTPYDPGDKQSQIRYIEKWFDKLLVSIENTKSVND